MGSYPGRQALGVDERYKEMFGDLKAFNDTLNFDREGLISEVCAWYYKQSEGFFWISALHVKYGSGDPVPHGTLGIEGTPHCVRFMPDDPIVEVKVTAGLYVEEIEFVLSSGTETNALSSGPSPRDPALLKANTSKGEIVASINSWVNLEWDPKSGKTNLVGIEIQFARKV